MLGVTLVNVSIWSIMPNADASSCLRWKYFRGACAARTSIGRVFSPEASSRHCRRLTASSDKNVDLAWQAKGIACRTTVFPNLSLFTRRHKLTVIDGLVYWLEAPHYIALPERACTFMLQELHETHPGMTVINLACTVLWYPRPAMCAVFASTCGSSWPETSKRWSLLHVDLAGQSIFVSPASHSRVR